MPDKEYGLFEGSVTNREDPEGRGRIKLTIPGLFEPETPMWVQPIGCPAGGHAKRGHFEPPAVGANIGIQFVQGDSAQPRYYVGPWGMPSGVSDVPTGGVVEGDNRQNAVTEDEEWIIERDSRSSGQKYLIKHKLSNQAIFIDASADEIHIVRKESDQAFLRGTEYRTAETAALTDLASALATAGARLGLAGNDSTFKAAFFNAAAEIVLAGAALSTGSTVLGGTDLAGDSTAYLSDNLFSE